MNSDFQIRLITEQDAQEVLEIYAPYVLNSAITFEYKVPTPEEFVERIKTICTEYPWLICLHKEKVIAYAYGSRHRYKKAYDWSVEATIYISPEFHGKGIARILYETLFSIFKLQGYFSVYAGVGLPNQKSVGLHIAVGFEEIGDFKKIGYKLGKWHDVKWFQLHLAEHIHDPPLPKPIVELESSEALQTILFKANKRIIR